MKKNERNAEGKCTAPAPKRHPTAPDPRPPPHPQGLSRVESRLADEALDAPAAPAAFEALLARADKEGWLPAELKQD